MRKFGECKQPEAQGLSPRIAERELTRMTTAIPAALAELVYQVEPENTHLLRTMLHLVVPEMLERIEE